MGETSRVFVDGGENRPPRRTRHRSPYPRSLTGATFCETRSVTRATDSKRPNGQPCASGQHASRNGTMSVCLHSAGCRVVWAVVRGVLAASARPSDGGFKRSSEGARIHAGATGRHGLVVPPSDRAPSAVRIGRRWSAANLCDWVGTADLSEGRLSGPPHPERRKLATGINNQQR